MLASVLTSATRAATGYFYLPIEEEVDQDLTTTSTSTNLPWAAPPTPIAPCSNISPIHAPVTSTPPCTPEQIAVVNDVLLENDLYKILGVTRSAKPDTLALRKAYFARCKACHPDKYPNNLEATRAFQKVAVAYDVLSKPSSRRLYDSRPPSSYDLFASRPLGYADQTFTNCVLGVFNDFLDGDLDMVRTLLRAVNDINPAIRLGDDGVDSVLVTLESIRQRALTCRTCILALHNELTRLLEIQHAFRQLSYFDLRRRSHLTVQLARLTLSLPFAVEQAILEQGALKETAESAPGAELRNIVPRRVGAVIRAMVVVLERMEGVLK